MKKSKPWDNTFMNENMREETQKTGEILAGLIRRTRSFRRFRQEIPIPREALESMIEAARLGGSARNIQPLKYMVINSPQMCRIVFPHLAWAGYLERWRGPEEGERPPAYIVCLLDTTLTDEGSIDLGIASQNLLLTASAMGYGGCRIASVSGRLAALLQIPDSLQILLVIALGVPKEVVELTPLPADGDIRYWRDERMIHYVPKRTLDEIIISPVQAP